MSLARLWHQQGKRTEAHRMLLEIYNWFTEGFDTKDLQEAKALLGACSKRSSVGRNHEGTRPTLRRDSRR